MPTYDLVLLLKKMDRPLLVNSLKRSANYILEQGGVIKNMENLGFRQTPYRMTVHGVTHKEANYFILNFVIPKEGLLKVTEELSRDKDVVRKTYVLKDHIPGGALEQPKKECTLHEDLLPPPYRKKVQEMLTLAEKNRPYKRYDFEYRSGMDYYPFGF